MPESRAIGPSANQEGFGGSGGIGSFRGILFCFGNRTEEDYVNEKPFITLLLKQITILNLTKMEKENKKLTKEELLKLTGGDAIDSILSSNGNGSKDLCSTLTCDEGCVENCKKGCKPSCKNESKYGVDLG